MAVWFRRLADSVWVVQDVASYELINNTAVLQEAPSVALYDNIEIRVADVQDELIDSPSDIAIVAGLATEIIELSSEPVATYLANAGANATAAQLEAWNTEAERMTADSYATQPAGEFVKIYTSNGDGTFSSSDTTEYSSLHYSVAAQRDFALGNISELIATTGMLHSQVAIVNGYDVSGDGGGGTFVYDSTQVGVTDGQQIFNGWVRQRAISSYDNNTVDVIGMHGINDAIQKLDRPDLGSPYVSITGYGDSMVSTSYTVGTMVTSLQNRYGLGGFFTPGLGETWLGASWTLAGGATQPFTDFTYFPGANQIEMPVGSSATTTTGDLLDSSAHRDSGFISLDLDFANFELTKVTYFYLTKVGDGTLTFTTTQAGAIYAPDVVDCNGALSLQKVEVLLTGTGPVTVSAAATTNACTFVGCALWLDSGIMFWSSGVGGSTMNEQNNYISAGSVSTVYATLASELNTSLFVHAQRATDDINYKINYAEVFTALNTAFPTASQLILGEPPQLAATTIPIPEMNSFLSVTARGYGFGFIDQYKLLGSSNDVLTSLHWGDGAGGVHLEPLAHRYLAGQILHHCNYFQSGENLKDIEKISKLEFMRDRTMLMGFSAMKENAIIGAKHSLLDGAISAGGYTYASNNDRGFTFTSAAALGYYAGRIGIVNQSPSIRTTSTNFSISIRGFRNLTLPTGVKSFMVFGANTTFASVSSITERCFGIEFAYAPDVGVAGTEAIRLFSTDGTTPVYSDWINALAPGSAGSNVWGMNVMITWDSALGEFNLFIGQSANAIKKFAVNLISTDLKTTDTLGPWVTIGIEASDAGNIPVAVGNFSVNNITSIWEPKVSDVVYYKKYGTIL